MGVALIAAIVAVGRLPKMSLSCADATDAHFTSEVLFFQHRRGSATIKALTADADTVCVPRIRDRAAASQLR
jgi:hypothetical protein